MPLLKVGRNHIDTDKIANVVSPSTQGVHEDAVVVRFIWGAEQVFLGEEAETLRQWLAGQVETPKPAHVPLVTKSEPQATNKSIPRR